MSKQFPNDEKNGELRAVVHIWAATIDPRESSAFADRVSDFMRNVGVGLEGFVEGRVLEADDGKSVIVMSSWKSRHMWARAEWQDQVGNLLAELSQWAVKIVDTMCYERAAIDTRCSSIEGD